MTTKLDIPRDLIEDEILPRVSITSLRAVRSTCKEWEASTKTQILGKAARASKPYLGFMLMDYKVCSLKFDLHGLRNSGEFVKPNIKQVSILDQIEISQVFHCAGLLLCVIKDNKGLVVWNPYMGQIKWIQPRDKYEISDVYAFGYDENRNHKILRIFFDDNLKVSGYEIYDLSSDSWKVVYDTPAWDCDTWIHEQPGVSLNGNTYFLAQDVEAVIPFYEYFWEEHADDFLLCFDFTTERFGPHLPLPYNDNNVSLSCVGDEKLAVFYQRSGKCHVLEIWVTNKIDPNGVSISWSKFLGRFDGGVKVYDIYGGSFFIDEDKEVAVVFDVDRPKGYKTCLYPAAHIIGQDGYLKSLSIGEALNLGTPDESGYVEEKYRFPLVCSSYVPSLVQL
ncbi:unnamed protein product [Microthlaspi erraticum]|uniref:F-box associated beta-propeller type 1 domain-containing protein n=1 Tax=Microthlaspi erraticum TaxID=1685480 RepID=A0A6D2L469_9BRAS|nr:unnamed protein product [Microthlaspi erraticum]CAA7057895.1 unnamed protein product [Microthlaspi erraticum]